MARALQVKYRVRVITTPSGLAAVRAAGLSSLGLLADWEDRLAAVIDVGRKVGSNPFLLYRQLSLALQIQQQVKLELSQEYRTFRPDLLIADFTLASIGSVAQTFGIPWWTSLPSPSVLEGGEGPPAYLGGLTPLSGPFGIVRDRLGRMAVRTFKQLVSALLHRPLKQLKLWPIYRNDGTEAAYSNQRILMIGLPELEFRKQWPAFVNFVPPFLYVPPGNHAPPKFVPYRNHVLVTLGTHQAWIKDRVAKAVYDLAQQTPDVEYHFSDGDAGGAMISSQGNFTRYAFIDYRQHLKCYDLVVHHGGSGIMYHCLAAGRPSVVYPLDYDQFDNAARIEYKGLGVRLRSLARLEQALSSTLENQVLRNRVEAFAANHAFESGDSRLLDLVTDHFEGGRD